MRARLMFCFLVLFLQTLLSLVGASTRNFGPNHDFALNNQLGTAQSSKSLQIIQSSNELKGLKKIGSSPPSCEHKCYGCSPCEAIQVPTTTSRVGVQYTNYEPEGWKCKCGPTFYSP